MIIQQLNTHYFTFTFELHDLAKKELTTDFLAALKKRIPGERRNQQARRFYLPDDNLWAIHKGEWNNFRDLVKEYFDSDVENPFIQKELFDE